MYWKLSHGQICRKEVEKEEKEAVNVWDESNDGNKKKKEKVEKTPRYSGITKNIRIQRNKLISWFQPLRKNRIVETKNLVLFLSSFCWILQFFGKLKRKKTIKNKIGLM